MSDASHVKYGPLLPSLWPRHMAGGDDIVGPVGPERKRDRVQLAETISAESESGRVWSRVLLAGPLSALNYHPHGAAVGDTEVVPDSPLQKRPCRLQNITELSSESPDDSVSLPKGPVETALPLVETKPERPFRHY